MIIPKALFFDMDGVLYDSMPNHEMSWQQSFAKYGIDFPAEEAYVNEGRTGRGTINVVFQRKYNRDATADEIEAIYGEKTNLIKSCSTAPLMPSMADFIEYLRSVSIEVFVVTGSKQPTLLEKLGRDYGIDAQHLVSAANVTHGKPHPEPYLKALQMSRCNANECAVVENAPLGVLSAKAAGIFTVAVNTGKLADEYLTNAGCDILFHGTTEMCIYWKTFIEQSRN